MAVSWNWILREEFEKNETKEDRQGVGWPDPLRQIPPEPGGPDSIRSVSSGY